jgi:GTPase SAR1 family protein
MKSALQELQLLSKERKAGLVLLRNSQIDTLLAMLIRIVKRQSKCKKFLASLYVKTGCLGKRPPSEGKHVKISDPCPRVVLTGISDLLEAPPSAQSDSSVENSSYVTLSSGSSSRISSDSNPGSPTSNINNQDDKIKTQLEPLCLDAGTSGLLTIVGSFSHMLRKARSFARPVLKKKKKKKQPYAVKPFEIGRTSPSLSVERVNNRRNALGKISLRGGSEITLNSGVHGSSTHRSLAAPSPSASHSPTHHAAHKPHHLTKTTQISLIGMQGAGKSTIFKQCKHEYSGQDRKLSTSEQKQAKKAIVRAVLTRAKIFVRTLSLTHTNSEAILKHSVECLDEGFMWADTHDELEAFDLDAAFDLTHGCWDSHKKKEQGNVLAEMVHRIQRIMQDSRVQKLNGDVEAHVDMMQTLSAELEALFMAGGFFISRISDIVSENYEVSHEDFVRIRVVTQGYHDLELNIDVGGAASNSFVLRDIGGDALNQGLWREAIESSYCTLFVVSLMDYAKYEGNRLKGPRCERRMKFETAREMLWDQLNSLTKPRIVVIFNKQDEFRRSIKAVPLQRNPQFEEVAKQDHIEPPDDHNLRMEWEIVKYFKTEPQVCVEKKQNYAHCIEGEDNAVFDHIVTVAANREMLMEKLKPLLLGLHDKDMEDRTTTGRWASMEDMSSRMSSRMSSSRISTRMSSIRMSSTSSGTSIRLPVLAPN